MKTLKLNYTGRKARIGKICFDEKGNMYVFVNYCSDCRGKVVMTTEEARQFSKLYQAEQGSLLNRVLFYLIGRHKAVAYESDPHTRSDESERIRKQVLQEVNRALQMR